MRFAQPVPTRILFEEDITALKTLSTLLTFHGTSTQRNKDFPDELTKTAFLNMARTIDDRMRNITINYEGEEYIIMAKGRRRLVLGFKREPDLYIGKDYGVNFIDACNHYFMLSPLWQGYNKKKNTLCGRLLYCLTDKEVYDYESGIVKNNDGYSTWFRVCEMKFTLAEVKSKGEAVIAEKTLNSVFGNLITLKITKP